MRTLNETFRAVGKSKTEKLHSDWKDNQTESAKISRKKQREREGTLLIV